MATKTDAQMLRDLATCKAFVQHKNCDFYMQNDCNGQFVFGFRKMERVKKYRFLVVPYETWDYRIIYSGTLSGCAKYAARIIDEEDSREWLNRQLYGRKGLTHEVDLGRHQSGRGMPPARPFLAPDQSISTPRTKRRYGGRS